MVVRYPNGTATANEIHIPTARRLQARIDSANVIHDFWAPELAQKMDAARTRLLWLDLFSAHVVQHFLLALIIAPLWLHSISRQLPERALRPAWLRRIERELARLAPGWLLGVGTMLAWHIPLLFNWALVRHGLHIVQHLSFLLTGTIFWWPLAAPLEERRLPILISIGYLFSGCIACNLLGAVLTFSPPGAIRRTSVLATS